MKNLTLENIARVCGGTYYGPADKLQEEVMSVITDSRKAEEGCLFVPIVGERVDAHKFIPQVMEAGALATLSERVLDNADFPYIAVESSLQDDKLITVKEYEKIKPVFFGMSNECQVYGDKIVSRGLKGMTCTIHLGDTAFTVDIPMPGRHMVYNALAAAAVGNIYGLTTEQIKAGIESLEPISGRFRMIETDKFLIVDDCYNANPMSMKASLDVLQDGAGRRIAVLGDMGELGENEVQLHEEVGEHAGKCDIDVLICTGKLCRNMAERAQRTNPDLKVIYEPDRESLLEHLEGYVQDGDTILVKASHFMKFEEVVTKLENM